MCVSAHVQITANTPCNLSCVALSRCEGDPDDGCLSIHPNFDESGIRAHPKCLSYVKGEMARCVRLLICE